MHTENVAPENGEVEAKVVSSSKNVICLRPQPPKGTGMSVFQGILNASGWIGSVFGKIARKETTEKGADESAARNCRHHIHVSQAIAFGERLKYAERERGATNAAARNSHANALGRHFPGWPFRNIFLFWYMRDFAPL